MLGATVDLNPKMPESRDQRSSSLEPLPKFPKCSHFRRRDDNYNRCQQCRFNEGKHEFTRETPCSVCETWLPENCDTHEKARTQQLKRKAASVAKKLQESSMDDSIEIHVPEELCVDLRRKRVINLMRRFATSPSPTSQPRVTVAAVCSTK